MDNTTKIIENINSNPDGITIDPRTGEKVTPSNGYAVALTDNKTEKPTESFINDLLRNINGLNQNAFIGSWFDDKNQAYYVDISLIVDDLNTAKTIGQVFKQRSIFDFSTFNTIDLN